MSPGHLCGSQSDWTDRIAGVLLPLGEEERLTYAALFCLEIGGCWIEPDNANGAADLFCEYSVGGVSSGPCATMTEAVATWIKAAQRRHLSREVAA